MQISAYIAYKSLVGCKIMTVMCTVYLKSSVLLACIKLHTRKTITEDTQSTAESHYFKVAQDMKRSSKYGVFK